MRKKIDVIVPVYNGLPYVLKTLESIVAQTLPADKIIVVNDGSTDNTKIEIENFINNHPGHNVHLIDKPNGGHSSATNEGIRNSQAEYIALVDADDLWEPSKLEKQIQVFETSKIENLGVVFCNYDNINKQDEVIVNYPSFKMDLNAKGKLFHQLISRGNLIAGSNSAVLLKKECFEKAGFFDEKLRCGEDWDMWIRISQYFSFDYVPETLVHLRRHENNLSNIPMIHLRSNLYILRKWIRELHALNGYTMIAEHLSLGTVSNLWHLFTKSIYKQERIYVKELTLDFPFPRIIIIWGLARKVRKKIMKKLIGAN